jgi:hypothetical protein
LTTSSLHVIIHRWTKKKKPGKKKDLKAPKKSECFVWEKGEARGPSFHILRSLSNSVALVLGTK